MREDSHCLQVSLPAMLVVISLLCLNVLKYPAKAVMHKL